MSQRARWRQWRQRLIRLEPLIHCYGNMAGQIVQRAPIYVVFSVLRIDLPFQDGVDVSRDPGGNLLPLHPLVRRCRQRRPSLVRTGPPATVYLPSHQGWTGMNWGGGSIKPTSTFLFCRGDPTLVKINVAITTGYLISGETNTMSSAC